MTDPTDRERIAVLETRVGFLEKRADGAKEREHFIINAVITLVGVVAATVVALVIAYVRAP